jgi:ATP-dependent RNA helicase DDX56/DBP9
MKRKLDENDVPTVEVTTAPHANTFESLQLDPRLLQAISKEKYSTPTLVQASTIPLVLEGKDVIARANTGSGKTAAYALPTLHSILQKRSVAPGDKYISTLVLVPTKELAEQVHKSFTTFSAFCSKEVRSINLTQRASDAVLRAILQDLPDIVVSTPGRASQYAGSGILILDRLTRLVIDEADLVLSYGYEDDINALSAAIPRGIQTILMSATLTTEVDTLKGLFCRDAVVLKLDEKQGEGEGITQYVVKCAEDEKFLLIFIIFKLRLVKGKCIIFVGDVDRSYRLKLFLEQFSIRSCVLNSELPINSRLHVVQEFNKGVYDIIIAADDQEVLGGIASKQKLKSKSSEIDSSAKQDNVLASDASDSEHDTQARPKSSQTRKDKDYGVSRGIDFQNVACVMNFDLPTSSKSYTHRIGRTARAGKTGMALSFVVPQELFGKHKPTSISSARHDEKVLEKMEKREAKKGREIKPYHFDMTQVDSFRYRLNDALRAVTRTAVREARAREIKQELLKSEKLKRHFEENPDDLRHLRHDGETRTARVQGHLKHVPDYLMPAKGRKALSVDEVGFVGLRKVGEDKRRKAKLQRRIKGRHNKPKTKGRIDPLKSFRAQRKK